MAWFSEWSTFISIDLCKYNIFAVLKWSSLISNYRCHDKQYFSSYACIHYCSWVYYEIWEVSSSLTLGAHAQRGLLYSVCLSVGLSVRPSVWYNTPGLSSGPNAEISTSTKCKRYPRVFWLVDFTKNASFKRYDKICKLRSSSELILAMPTHNFVLF